MIKIVTKKTLLQNVQYIYYYRNVIKTMVIRQLVTQFKSIRSSPLDWFQNLKKNTKNKVKNKLLNKITAQSNIITAHYSWRFHSKQEFF